MPVLSPEMQQQKEAREHKEYNDMMRAKQALMMIPGMNLAQDDQWESPEEIFAQVYSYQAQPATPAAPATPATAAAPSTPATPAAPADPKQATPATPAQPA